MVVAPASAAPVESLGPHPSAVSHAEAPQPSAPEAPAEEVQAPVEHQSLGLPALPARESLPLPAASTARSPLTGSVMRTAVSLGIVVGLIVVLATLYKKFAGGSGAGFSLLPTSRDRRRGGAGPSGIVEVLARYPLDTGLTLLLLKVDRRVLLLSQSGSLGLARFLGRRGAGGGGGAASLSTLAEFTEPADVASILSRISEADGSSMNARFRQLVERFGNDHDGAAADDGRVHTTSRFVRTNDEGDSAELLDERSLLIPSPPREPTHDLPAETPETPATYAFRAPHLGAAPPRVHPAPAARRTTAEPDAVASLKRRLESMRAAGGRGAGR